jgi:hypothetical protein
MERRHLPSNETVIDRPEPVPGQGPTPQPTVPTTAPGTFPPSAPGSSSGAPRRRGVHLGPIRITPALVLVVLALLGSGIFVGYVTLAVDDNQIPLLGAGFGVMGLSFAAVAIGALVAMWRAASEARAGRALGMALVGGAAALAAIGCLTFTVLGTMLWRS